MGESVTMGDMYDLNFKWLDYKIDTNYKELVSEIKELKIQIKNLDESIIKLKEERKKIPFWKPLILGNIDNYKIDMMDLEN